MINIRTIAVSSLLVLLMWPEAKAQKKYYKTQAEADSAYSRWEDSAIELNQLVVTGTRTPKTLKDTPIQTRLITTQDIGRVDATNVQDLLQQELPGVEFSYAMSQQMHMNFSGFGGQSVLFLVDGERLAGETQDDIDFTRLNMSNVERIEIVKGAASALYGSNAAGGVINVITKAPAERWSVNVNGRMGSHNQYRYGGSLGLNGNKVQNLLTFTATGIDSYDVTNGPHPQTINVVTTYRGDKTMNVAEKLTWRPTEALRLTARAGYFYRQLESATPSIPDRYRDFTGGLRGLWTMTDKDQLELSYNFDQFDRTRYYRAMSQDIRIYSNVQNSVRMLYNHNLERGDVFTLGGDYLYDFLLNEKMNDRKHHQESFDLFAQYDLQLPNHWEVVTALRYDYFTEGGHSRLTPKVNLRYRPLSALTLRLGYGMGFRAATLKEQYYVFNLANIWDIVGGNMTGEKLRPEVSHNFNASADWTRGAWNLTASGYYNIVHDRLTTGTPRPISEFTGDKHLLSTKLWLPYTNLAQYDTYGFDLTAQARWQNGWGVKLSYAYVHEQLGKDKQGEIANNQYTPARPHALTLRADWDRQLTANYGLNVALSGRAMSGVDNVEFVDYVTRDEAGHLLRKDVSYHGYSLWKLQVAQRFGSWLKVTVTADNLLGYNPEYHYFNAPFTDGRTFLVGASIDLK